MIKIIQSENRISSKCDSDDHPRRKRPWTEGGSAWQLISIIYSRIYCIYVRSLTRGKEYQKATRRRVVPLYVLGIRNSEIIRRNTNEKNSKSTDQDQNRQKETRSIDYLPRASHNFIRKEQLVKSEFCVI